MRKIFNQARAGHEMTIFSFQNRKILVFNQQKLELVTCINGKISGGEYLSKMTRHAEKVTCNAIQNVTIMDMVDLLL